MKSEKLAYRVREAAKALGVSQQFLYKLIARNEIRAARLGNAILIPHAELQKLLESASADSAS